MADNKNMQDLLLELQNELRSRGGEKPLMRFYKTRQEAINAGKNKNRKKTFENILETSGADLDLIKHSKLFPRH